MEEIAHAVTVEALLSVCWSIVRLNGLAGHRERLIWIRNMPEGAYGVWFPWTSLSLIEYLLHLSSGLVPLSFLFHWRIANVPSHVVRKASPGANTNFEGVKNLISL